MASTPSWLDATALSTTFSAVPEFGDEDCSSPPTGCYCMANGCASCSKECPGYISELCGPYCGQVSWTGTCADRNGIVVKKKCKCYTGTACPDDDTYE